MLVKSDLSSIVYIKDSKNIRVLKIFVFQKDKKSGKFEWKKRGGGLSLLKVPRGGISEAQVATARNWALAEVGVPLKNSTVHPLPIWWPVSTENVTWLGAEELHSSSRHDCSWRAGHHASSNSRVGRNCSGRICL